MRTLAPKMITELVKVKRFATVLGYLALGPLGLSGVNGFANPAGDEHYGSVDSDPQMSRAEQQGRDIWYKATAGNKRHHSMVLQQRFGAPFDWYGVFGSQTRGQRFKSYGLITDPDCRPGNEASYGFDICPGDEQLLKFVGKTGYRDPACDFDDSGDGSVAKEDACKLEFGTSTGSLGYRKFPNPRFRPERWQGWAKYNPQDASQQPPFLFGTTCGSCHIGLNPARPPRDPEAPTWDNIAGAVGNDQLALTAIHISGMNPHSPYYQALAHVQPGTVDTSAEPTDQIHNPGTINAIINTDKRPTFVQDIKRWRRNAVTRQWELSTKTEPTLAILKGGEDTVGADLAVLRVYVNIGMCSEACWQNNLININQFSGTGVKQRPFDIAQCRRDCANWRAVEDRVDSVTAFLLSRRPSDLKDAQEVDGSAVGPKIIAAVEQRYNPDYAAEGGVFAAGRQVFARNCATCHSSQKPRLPGQPRDEGFFSKVDFLARDANGVRIDWLGNDERTDVSKVGTNRCRALHSNHMQGHIWEQFASENYKNAASPSGVPELAGQAGGGRGYYRNISLLSVWAHAPFMHNNAIGPELCVATYAQKFPCVNVDTSVDGRLALYEASMHELLYPQVRLEKVAVTTEDIGLTLQVPFTGQPIPLPIQVSLPKGTPVGLIASLDIKSFVNHQINELRAQLAGKDPLAAATLFEAKVKELLATKESLVRALSAFSNCSDLIENKGHTFGAELSDHDKTALIQYMKLF